MLSKKDEKIIELLQQDANLSTREIGDKLSMPITTVHNRIKKMENDGVIRKYVAVVDHKKLDRGLQAFIQVSVTYATPSGEPISQENLAKRIYQLPEVENCYIMTGTTDILVQVFVRDVEELNNFVIGKLRNLEGVQNTLTGIVLSDVSEKAVKHLQVQ